MNNEFLSILEDVKLHQEKIQHANHILSVLWGFPFTLLCTSPSEVPQLSRWCLSTQSGKLSMNTDTTSRAELVSKGQTKKGCSMCKREIEDVLPT